MTTRPDVSRALEQRRAQGFTDVTPETLAALAAIVTKDRR